MLSALILIPAHHHEWDALCSLPRGVKQKQQQVTDVTRTTVENHEGVPIHHFHQNWIDSMKICRQELGEGVQVWSGQFCSQRFQSRHSCRWTLCSIQIHAYKMGWCVCFGGCRWAVWPRSSRRTRLNDGEGDPHLTVLGRLGLLRHQSLDGTCATPGEENTHTTRCVSAAQM